MPVRRLDIDAIIDTAQRLAERVEDRFAGRGISGLAADLVLIGTETKERIGELHRPRWVVRVVVVLVVAVAISVLVLTAGFVHDGGDINGVTGWLAFVQAGVQDLVFLGIGALFLSGLEGRLRRRHALAGLHELRTIAHIIDMHQLTKDPEAILSSGRRAAHSPEHMTDRFELARYLEYCSEMLALTNKLAALYAQDIQDPVVLNSVGDVQQLVGILSGKIWQKLVIIDTAASRRSD